jgi:hypothetical protein
LRHRCHTACAQAVLQCSSPRVPDAPSPGAKETGTDASVNDSSDHPPAKSRQQHGCLAAINRAINGTIERAFAKLGYAVGRWPWAVIVISAICAIALASGMARLKMETRGEELWIPGGTQSKRDADIVQDLYPSFGRAGAPASVCRILMMPRTCVCRPSLHHVHLQTGLRITHVYVVLGLLGAF